MTVATTAQGTPVDLSQVSASGWFNHETTTVVFLHASVGVYTPAEDGLGSYCFHAVCEHDHPDTNDGVVATRECGARLSRIINSGKRIPKWATLHNG